MSRRISRFEKILREDPLYADLMRVLQQDPAMMTRVFLAAASAEILQEITREYATNSEAGFEHMEAFLVELEKGTTRDAQGMTVTDRFLQWLRLRYFWPEMEKRILQYEACGDTEHAKQLRGAVSLIRHETCEASAMAPPAQKTGEELLRNCRVAGTENGKEPLIN